MLGQDAGSLACYFGLEKEYRSQSKKGKGDSLRQSASSSFGFWKFELKKKGTSYILVQDVYFIYEYSLKNGPEHNIVFKLCHLDFLALCS